MKKFGFSTDALHAGQTSFQPDSMSAPIYQSVAYPFFDAKEAAAISSGEKPGFFREERPGWAENSVFEAQTIASTAISTADLSRCHRLWRARQ